MASFPSSPTPQRNSLKLWEHAGIVQWRLCVRQPGSLLPKSNRSQDHQILGPHPRASELLSLARSRNLYFYKLLGCFDEPGLGNTSLGYRKLPWETDHWKSMKSPVQEAYYWNPWPWVRDTKCPVSSHGYPLFNFVSAEAESATSWFGRSSRSRDTASHRMGQLDSPPHGTHENDAIQWSESLCNQVNILVRKKFFFKFCWNFGVSRQDTLSHPSKLSNWSVWVLIGVGSLAFFAIPLHGWRRLKETWAVTTAVTVRSCRCWAGRCSHGHQVLDDPLAQSQCKPDFLLHLAHTKCEDWARLGN